MTDTEQTKSTLEKESQTFVCCCPCGNVETMTRMMRGFFSGDKGDRNCGTRMQQMFCGTPEESNNQE